MPFKIVDPNGVAVIIPTKTKVGDDYKATYAHGAQGGFLGNYHFRLDFYREEMPPLEFTEVEGRIEQSVVKEGVKREIVVSVYVPVPFVKELANWLNTNIKQYESEYGEIKILADLVGTQQES